MNKKIGIILLTLVLTFSNCSSSFIARTKSRNIKLKGINENSIKVGTENNKVLILFDKNELLNLFEKEYLDFNNPSSKERINELKSLKKNFIFKESEWKGKMKYSSYELMFHELLKKGKAEIFDKRKELNIYKIKYTFVEDKLGGQDCYFSFKNGNEFYEIVLAYGE